MVMERVRPSVKNILDRVGRIIARVAPNPDALTLLGGLLAWTAVALAWVGEKYAAATMIPVSAAVDALDGAVARATRGASKRGEFLDSVVDRLSDTAYFLTLYLLGVPAAPAVVGAGLAVSISYVRAKGELVGVSMRGVGLMERGDRTVALFLVALLAAMGLASLAAAAAWLVAVLMALTVLERVLKVLGSLGSS